MASKLIKRARYFIPFVGRIRLIKRLEKLEREYDALKNNGEFLIKSYECRLNNIYEKVIQRID